MLNNITRKVRKKNIRGYGLITPYLYLLPALSIMIIFVFIPLLQAFLYSFQDYNMFTSEFVGLKNYKNLFTDKYFIEAFINTIKYFIVAVPILIIVPLFIAILVNKKLMFIKVYRAAFYIPVVTSMVVAAIAWGWLYNEKGLINYFLISIISIIDKPIPWLTSGDTALYSVMIVTIWKGMGYYMVIYLAALQSVSSDVWEAAAIDGATGLKKHLKITIPLCAPYMAVVAVMSSIAAMKVFEEIFVMTKGGPYGSSRTLVYYIYETGMVNFKMGYASAMGFVLFIILLAFSILSDKLSNKGDE